MSLMLTDSGHTVSGFRFSYLQTFPEQGHISSPLLVIWWRTVIGSDWLPFRMSDSYKKKLCEMEKQEKPKRKREGQGQGSGSGGCLLKGWPSVYYKLKILLSLVCSRHGGWVGYICVSVAPKPNSWRLEGSREGTFWNNRWTTRHVVQCLHCIYMSECVCVCMCMGWCIHVRKLHAAVALVKSPVSHRVCVSSWTRAWIVLLTVSNLFEPQLRQCYESKLMTVLLLLTLKLWRTAMLIHSIGPYFYASVYLCWD